MIPKQEIMALATELQLQAHVVEKDYALGWFLAGIAAHPVIGSRWVFKGGTCLKKCYFETYRFSEDLDFTAIYAQPRGELREHQRAAAPVPAQGHGLVAAHASRSPATRSTLNFNSLRRVLRFGLETA